MKRLVAGVLVVVGVFAVSVAIAWQVDTTQASDDGGLEVASDSLARGVYGGSDPGLSTSRPGNGAGEGGDADQGSDGTPFAGIVVRTLPPDQTEEMAVEGGAVVERVLDDGPSAGALQSEDVITAIRHEDEAEATAIASASDVVEKVTAAQPGDILTFTINREGEVLDVGVTLGGRPAGITVRKRLVAGSLPDIPDGLLDLTGKLVSAEIVVETDDGFQTFRAVVGTVSEVDVDSGTFTLAPADGSDSIAFTISDGTWADLRHDGDLGPLDTEHRTLVVTVADDEGEEVVWVVQRDLALIAPFSPGALLVGPKLRQPGMELQRHRYEFRGLGSHSPDREFLREFEGLGRLRDRLGEGLPSQVREMLERLELEHDDLDLDIQIESLPGSLRELLCDEETREDAPERIVIRCSNLGSDSTH